MIGRSISLFFCIALLGGLGTANAQLTDSRLELQPVVSGLTLPTSLVFVGPDDFLVSQKNDGRVRRVTGGTLQGGEVLDLHVNFRSEQGLLSMVRDPDFVHNGFIFLYYTESSTGADSNADDTALGNRVYRYTWSGGALVQPEMILDLPTDIPFPALTPGPHNGGAMAFGPDDYLYVLIGDLAQGNNEAWSGQLQNVATGTAPNDTGVILRVNRAGRGPRDNPLFNAADPADPLNRYFAYGIRNSFGMAFDPVSGELWQSENGPTDMDEINRVFGGFNGGWIRIKGPVALDVEGPVDLWMAPGAVYGDPEFVWSFPVAPTAVAFVASRKLGCDLEHDMIVGDFGCRQLYKFELDPARQSLEFTAPGLQDKTADNQPDPCVDDLSELIFGSGVDLGAITDLENGPDGRLYVVQYTTGSVTRIAPAAGAVVDLDSDEVDDACDCDAADGSAFAVPELVPTLRVNSKPATTLGWDGQAATAGAGTVYRVVSGTLGDLKMFGYGTACTLDPGSSVPQALDTRTPAPGNSFYYLVEAANVCARSGFGDGSNVPDPRDTLDGSNPPACP
jgi:glucose/arabinose dehydrogenase